MKACVTAGRHARARPPRVPTAPPSGRLPRRREAELRPFVVPPSPRGGWGTVESVLSGEEAQGQRNAHRQEEAGDEEEEAPNNEPQGCSARLKVNVINALVHDS